MKIQFKNVIEKDFVEVIFNEQKINSLVFKDHTESLLLGVGSFKDVKRRDLFLLARRIILFARQYKKTKIAIDFKLFDFKHLKVSDFELGEIIGTNFSMANYDFVKYKKTPENGWFFIDSIIIFNASKPAQDGIIRGQLIGDEVNACRDLANTPASDMTPEILAEKAKQASKGTGILVKVLDVDDMKILKMGGILGVGQGSDKPPRFIIMEYYGAKNKKESPIVITGKGITYDTGGINLKPTVGGFLNEMHMDMAGGAASIHFIVLASKLHVKKNIVVLVPTAENMISGSSYRPGDILKTMSGQTIEIVNTDAEGRVILSDALTYAEKYKPELSINIATLTGAAIVAVGLRASVIFTKDLKLEQQTRDAGEASGDYMWPLPLWDEYAEDIKGTYGDWVNQSKNPMYGGAITAALFLYQFAKKHERWMHIDIAPTMASHEGQYLSKGATGTPIRMLIKLLDSI